MDAAVESRYSAAAGHDAGGQWDASINRSLPCMDVVHSCRSFEQIASWAKEHKMQEFDDSVYVEDDI